MRVSAFCTLMGILMFAACSNDAVETPSVVEESLPGVAVLPGVYTVDRGQSEVAFEVAFTIIRLGERNVRGTFDEYEATVKFSGGDISMINATAVIQSASVNTLSGNRDGHLQSDDFFDVDVFPEITFVSTGVENVSGDSFDLVGDMTIRDVTQPVVFATTVRSGESSADGRHRIGLYGKTTIDRYDYGLTWNDLSGSGGVLIGRTVDIILDLQVILRLPDEDV